MRFSFTALQDFKKCPLKFKFGQIDRVKTPKRPEVVFGILIHECLQLVYEPNRSVPATEKEILDYFNKKWDSSIYQDPQADSFAFASGVAILKDFFAKNNPTQAKVVDLEKSFLVPVKIGHQEHQISGKIDRIDKTPNDGFEIIDYKTSKKIPAQKYIENNLQLAVYHLGLVTLWPQIEKQNRPVKTSLYFLKHGEKLSAQKTKADLKEAREELKQGLAEIEKAQAKNNWEPIPNPLCNWCGFKHLCPMFRHQFSPVPLPDAEKIKKVAEDFFSLKEEFKKLRQKEVELKHLLDKYMQANEIERVFGDSGFITRSKSQFFSYDPQKIKRILEPLGKFLEVVKIDTAKLKKLTKELPSPQKEALEETKKLERESKTFKLTRKL